MNQSKLKYTNLTTLPNSFLTEQAILNILFLNPFLIKKIISSLPIQSFYFEPHKLIYQTLCELCEQERVINTTTLITNLQDNERLEKIGGIDRIIIILNRFENLLDLDEYIKIINDKYIRRLIIELGKQVIAWGYLTSLNLEEIIEKIEKAVFTLNQQKISEKIYSAAEVIDDIFSEMKSKIKKENQLNFKSSFSDLDSIVQGFEKSDLIIIAGRPSMGKTAFALNLGKNIVEQYNAPLIIFSLEMSRQQILYRFISTQSNITSNRLKNGKMTLLEWQKLSKAMKHISQLPIFIDDNPNISLNEIRAKIRKIFKQKYKDGVVIIDYLQLMKLNLKLENRVQEISHITRNLKIMAKELQVPIIVLSQLSRGLESRVNKRPMLSDLRESGCITRFKKEPIINSWKKNEILKNNIEKAEFKGLKPTYKIKFENEIEICLTANHRVLSKQGWIKINQITKNSEFYCYSPNENNYKYWKLREIKYTGLQNVYEKTIPVYHNYLYENFILHNSIEQDADIVIMLYREDYYNEKKTDMQITELIVAKHRNGPVGTARLIFNPYITGFKNMNMT
jgi:replicative DNA helicase